MTCFPRVGAAAMLLLGSLPSGAQAEQAGNPALDAVLRCRTVTEPDKRLACFDKSAESLQAASASHDLIVVDRGEMRKARRSLFGFNLPNLNIFATNHDRTGNTPAGIEGEDDQITTTIASARLDAQGYWVIVLADGAVWHQTDGTIALPPRAGGAITIRKASLGSYFLRVGKQPGVKARRDR